MSSSLGEDSGFEHGVVPGDQLYFDLFDAVSTPVFIHRAGLIIYTNTALQNLSGFSRDELLSLPYYEMGHGEWRDILRERGARRMRGEILENVYEYRQATKDGHECWVEITASRLLLNGLTSVFCSLHDLTDRKRAEAIQKQMRQMLAQIIDSDPVATFVINAQHKVTHWNRVCATLTGISADEIVGTDHHWHPFYPERRPMLADLVVDGVTLEQVNQLYPIPIEASPLASNALEGERFLSQFGGEGRWFYITAAPLRTPDGRIIGAIQKIQDTTERHRAEEELHRYQASLEDLVKQRTGELASVNQQLEQDIARRETAEVELRRRYTELTELNLKLVETQQQLQQSEKLASIGQLAAGVAHEINNPIGYVYSNIGTLENYLDDLFLMLNAYEGAEPAIAAVTDTAAALQALRKQVDIDFLKEDIPMLMRESKEGITRVKKIVQDLKDFSRVDTSPEFQWANLHQGIDSTLNVVNNEIKYKAEVVKEYGELPEVECLPSQLNQVFLNLLVNAAHAMGEQRGCITIRTGVAGERVWLEFADNGSGMSEEVRQKVFDPFFTTKPVGKGTGLGLSLSYGIIQKHRGTIEVRSTLGLGTTFRITLPIRHGVESSGEKSA